MVGKDWNEIMFDNIGKKIQTVAKAIVWVEIIASILSGIVLFFYGLFNLESLWYLLILAPFVGYIGCIAAWLSVILLYGFGKLVEDVNVIRCSSNENRKIVFGDDQNMPHFKQASECECGELFYGMYCPSCGKKCVK